MTDFPHEIAGGVIQNVAAPRLQSNPAGSEQADVAFGRVMDFLNGRNKATSRKETEEQPSSPAAPPLQVFPSAHPEIAAELVAALQQEKAGGGMADEKTEAPAQESDVSVTPPLMSAPLAIAPLQFPANQSRAGLSRERPVAQLADTVRASSYLTDRLDRAVRGDRTRELDEGDQDAGAPVNWSETRFQWKEPKFIEALSPASLKICGVGSDARDSNVELATPPIKMRVSELETHLPVAVLNALPGEPRELTRSEATVESRPVETPEQQKAPVKVLKFELEPAALGGISVRMRVTHSRVDIQIAAENPSTSALLIDTRDALGAAIGEKGLSLHSYEVVNMSAATAPPSNAAGQHQSSFSEQQRNYAGERGFAGHDRDQRQGQEPQRHQRRRDETSAGLSSVDLVL